MEEALRMSPTANNNTNLNGNNENNQCNNQTDAVIVSLLASASLDTINEINDEVYANAANSEESISNEPFANQDLPTIILSQVCDENSTEEGQGTVENSNRSKQLQRDANESDSCDEVSI